MIKRIYNYIKSKVKLFFIGGVALASTIVPIVPQDMELLYSYQGRYQDQFWQEIVVTATSTFTVTHDRPTFPDDDMNGLVSVAIFKDSIGNKNYIQIPDQQYEKMTKEGGYDHNPKKKEFIAPIAKLIPEAEAAIAFDSADAGVADNAGVATSFTVSHTNTGSDVTLVVPLHMNETAGRIVTGCTYNGASLTNAATTTQDTSKSLLWYKINPTTGANDLTCTISGVLTGAKQIGFRGLSYTGTDQTTQPDSTGTNNLNDSTATSFAVSTTVVNANTWLVGGAGETAGEIAGGAAGAGTTYRGAALLNLMTADSNGIVSPGSRSLNWGRGAEPADAGDITGVIVSLNVAGGTSVKRQNEYIDE